MTTYLKISIIILVLNCIAEIVNKHLFKRKIRRSPGYTKMERMQTTIKTVIWSFLPIVRWILVYGSYLSLVRSDDELIVILNKNNKGHTFTNQNRPKQ